MNAAFGTVLITGGSSGIGLALAHRFAAAGHPLILTGRDEAALATAANEITRTHPVRVTTLASDLGSEAGIDALLSALAARGETIEVLVNNAGFGLHGNFVDTDPADDRALTTVHVLAPWRLTKALLPAMVERGRGGVINVGSVYSFSTAPWQSLYGAAKGWIVSLTLALREELRGTGVHLTALCPGTTLSRFRTRSGLVDRPSWFTLTCEEVALAGYRGFQRNRAIIVPGVYYKIYVRAARLLPASWLGRFVYHTAYRLRKMPVPALRGARRS